MVREGWTKVVAMAFRRWVAAAAAATLFHVGGQHGESGLYCGKEEGEKQGELFFFFFY